MKAPANKLVVDPFDAQPLPGRRRRPKTRYTHIASRIHASLTAGRRPDPVLVALLAVVAPSPGHALVARDLAEALGAGDLVRAVAIASTARCSPDRRAEKIVSRRYRFLWICNPKVASRSMIWALRAADPDALLIRGATVEDVHRAYPDTRGYYTFAFVRHPYGRAYSFYANKLAHRDANPARQLAVPHYGLAEARTFAAVCAWLHTPYGSDAFADRHWLSQHQQIRLPDARLPDFVGRYERLEADFATVARRLDLPTTDLPVLNTQAGWTATPEAAAALRDAAAARLADDVKAKLHMRYAEDFAFWNYGP